MDLPLALALLMKHPVPFLVLEPLLEALPLDWATVPTGRLVDALIEGSAEVRNLADGKDDLARYALPRLSWTPAQADAALDKAWAVGPGTTPHKQMSLAITEAVAPFASPLGRTRALKTAIQRSTTSTRYGAERLPELVDRLLELGCAAVWGKDSPYLTVASWRLFERLKEHGFPLLDPDTGHSLDARLRQRAPESFESPADRQKILAAVPAPSLPPDQKVLYLLSRAQRWTDVRAALKDVPDWTSLRFEDGESVVHKVARQDPEWALKLFSLPAMRQAPIDVAFDDHGRGQHLIGRMLLKGDVLKQAESLDVPAWTVWRERTTPVDLLVARLREQRRQAQKLAANVPATGIATALSALYWPEDALIEPWLAKIGSSMPDARAQALTSPVFQQALDSVAWNWPSPEHAYFAVENLLNPWAHAFRDPPNARASGATLRWFDQLPPADAQWLATHLLASATRHLSAEPWSMDPVHRLIDRGANWEAVDQLFTAGQLQWSKGSATDRSTLWASQVRQRWEVLQLTSGLNEDPTLSPAPATARRRL